MRRTSRWRKAPWAGPVAVYSADEDFGYRARTAVLRPATLGATAGSAAGGRPGSGCGRGVRVRLGYGQPAEPARGGRAERRERGGVAVRVDGGDWEVIQFRDGRADRARGLSAERDPAGAGGDRRRDARGLARGHGFRPARRRGRCRSICRRRRGGSSATIASGRRTGPTTMRATGICRGVRGGRAAALSSGASRAPAARRWRHRAAWIRRTRIDGDSWEGRDVPLGEERRSSIVRVLAGRRGPAGVRAGDAGAGLFRGGAGRGRRVRPGWSSRWRRSRTGSVRGPLRGSNSWLGPLSVAARW